MGTDIHLEVEVKRNGVWERLPHLPEACWSCAEYDPETGEYGEPKGFRYPWVKEDEARALELQGFTRMGEPRNGRVQMSKQESCYSCKGTKVIYPQIYHDRNYDVFGVLADVRNGTGFAGVDTGDGFEPISEPRGLPVDLSEEVLAALARNGQDATGEYVGGSEEDEDDWSDATEKCGWLGEHSFSWVTLREVLEYDWSRATKKRGWVDPWNFELYRRNGSPYSWSGGISGANVNHVTEWDMARMIDEGNIVFEGDDSEYEKPDDFRGRPYTTSLQRAMGDWDLPSGSVGEKIRTEQTYYCPIQWEQPYLESMGKFKAKMDALAEYAPDGDLDSVRLVFGFDS